MTTEATRRAGNKYRRTPHGKYSVLKRKCKYRRIPFDVSFAEYQQITSGKNCHYCGDPLPEAGTGLDRIDSDLGYVKGNVVPSCYPCNVQKGFLEGAGLPTKRVLEIMSELKERGIRVKQTKSYKPWALSVVLLFLLSVTAFAAPHKSAYTFDPQSIIKVEVDSHACKMQGTSGHCKHAEITFGAGMVVQTTPTVAPTAHFVPASAGKTADNQVIYTFKPADCRPLPARKNSADALLGIRYTCKNVSWR